MFFESFDEIFSLPASKKILVDEAYLYAILDYKWHHGLDVKIKHDKPLLFKKLNKELFKKLIQFPFTYCDRFKIELTVSQLKYLVELLNIEFAITCFQKTDEDIAYEESKQMCSKSKIIKKIKSILYKYENLEFSKKNEQSFIDEIKNTCLHFQNK